MALLDRRLSLACLWVLVSALASAGCLRNSEEDDRACAATHAVFSEAVHGVGLAVEAACSGATPSQGKWGFLGWLPSGRSRVDFALKAPMETPGGRVASIYLTSSDTSVGAAEQLRRARVRTCRKGSRLALGVDFQDGRGVVRWVMIDASDKGLRYEGERFGGACEQQVRER